MPREPSPIERIRAEGGAPAVRDALEVALARHPTRAAAARSLGIAPTHLRRVAASVGVVLERLPAGRPRR